MALQCGTGSRQLLGIMLVALLTFFTSRPAAQQKNGGGGMVPPYDSATEVTLSGTVSEIKDFDCKFSKAVERHVELKLADGSVMEVHLAPVKFLKDYEMTVTNGPTEILGSKVSYQNTATVLARKITQSERTYELRDAHGKPYW